MDNEELKQKIHQMNLAMDEFLKTIEKIKGESKDILKAAVKESDQEKISRIKEIINTIQP
ncbi:MAG: hypothetical protein NTW66_02085 [Candidatus Magasanikbacteria bacterium]|nr:hypothetical protein [Candidatus Magasanikbacteria bacterium]